MEAGANADPDDEVNVTARVWAYVPGDDDPPRVGGVVLAIHCDSDSATSVAACSALDALEETAPPPLD